MARTNSGSLGLQRRAHLTSKFCLGRRAAQAAFGHTLRANTSTCIVLLISMDYRFANLLGAPYRGGNLILHGTELLSAVGNRVSVVRATSCRLPCLRKSSTSMI